MQVTLESDMAQRAAAAQAALARVPGQQEQKTARTAAELLAIMQRVSHVLTGAMKASEAIDGPLVVGAGAIQYTIGPSVDYAPYEAARGGDHDFVGRTLAEGQAALAALQAELAGVIVEAFG